jgi:hypothetical protein
MQRDCYRCGHPLEERLAFCPACGAPQIRVSIASEQPSPASDKLGSDLTSSPSAPPLSPTLVGLAAVGGIEWSYFLRTAAPLAALTGLLTVRLPPLGFFVLLPASLIWTIHRYRQHRAVPLRRGQGARMGALMGLLSFGFFLVFFLTAVFLNQAKYREMVASMIQDSVAQTPDLQSQQMLQWVATPDGLITFTAISLAFILGFFLIIGMGSGALAVALGKARNRPEL